jgi:DNA modification methylase
VIRILTGDALETLKTLEAGRFQCCVTSPPYFSLRDYGVEGQIGLEATFEEWLEKLVAVFEEVKRVLRDDGVLFLNLGDSYAGAPHGAACDTPGKALEGSPDRGCLCGSLCDACRVAYQTGKAHNDMRRAPTQGLSPSAPSPAHSEALSARLPTSDSSCRADRSEVATLDPRHTPILASAPTRAALSSTISESSLQSPALYSKAGTLDALCQLCGCSLRGSTLASGRTSPFPCEHGLTLHATPDQGKSKRGKDATVGVSSHCIAGTKCPSSPYRYSTTTSIKPKDLIGQPWRLAFALRDAGWYLRSEIIWHKPNPMPESVEDRPTKSHEQVFLLSKRARYFYDADAVREPAVDDEATFYAKIIKKDHKATLDDPGLNGLHRTKAGFKHATYNPAGRSLRSVWSIPSAPFAEAHFATFPPALVIPCIKAGTSERGACPECGAPWVRMVEASGGTIGKGAWQPEDFRDSRMTKPSNDGTYSRKDLGFRPACDHGLEPRPCEVLDPFAGACTTLLVADRLGRDATGIELNPAYAEMGRKRIVNDCPLFASVAVGPSDRQAIEPTKETP